VKPNRDDIQVDHDYKPVVGSGGLPNGAAKIHYIVSLTVRDRHDFGEIYNPSPTTTRMTCDKYTS
jgi:hypothetical protein